jgi:tRNA(adenine34) deaminase
MPTDETDRRLMARCIGLSRASGKAGEYPYAAVIARHGKVVASSINRVKRDRDVTRHAEVCAIQGAQRALDTVSLDDCTIYVNAEPCAYCSYAIRESRIRRVVFGLTSPHMGGRSKWNVLGDTDLSDAMPEVFAPPPEIVGGFMQDECEKALVDWNPLIATIIKERGLFGVAPFAAGAQDMQRRTSSTEKIMGFLRRHLFDRFGRV